MPLVNLSTEGGGGVKNLPNPVYVVYEQPHSIDTKILLIGKNKHSKIDTTLLDKGVL